MCINHWECLPLLHDVDTKDLVKDQWADRKCSINEKWLSLCKKAFIEFVELIQKEQVATEVTIEQLSGGGRVRAKKKVVRHEKTIKKTMEAFTGGIRIIFI